MKKRKEEEEIDWEEEEEEEEKKKKKKKTWVNFKSYLILYLLGGSSEGGREVVGREEVRSEGREEERTFL